MVGKKKRVLPSSGGERKKKRRVKHLPCPRHNREKDGKVFCWAKKREGGVRPYFVLVRGGKKKNLMPKGPRVSAPPAQKGEEGN